MSFWNNKCAALKTDPHGGDRHSAENKEHPGCPSKKQSSLTFVGLIQKRDTFFDRTHSGNGFLTRLDLVRKNPLNGPKWLEKVFEIDTFGSV